MQSPLMKLMVIVATDSSYSSDGFGELGNFLYFVLIEVMLPSELDFYLYSRNMCEFGLMDTVLLHTLKSTQCSKVMHA